MNTLTQTDGNGNVYHADFNADAKGWYVSVQNDYNPVYIPYSRSFKINDMDYMATTINEAMRLGIMMLKISDEVFVAFEKNHPELNP